MGDNATAATTEKKSRKSYSLEKKLRCIATAKTLDNIDRDAELEGVPRTCLVKWMSAELKFKDASKTRGKNTKKLSTGRRIKLQELDTGLAEWIKERRAQKQKVTYKLILHEATLRLKKIPSGPTLWWMAPKLHASPPPPELYLDWVLEAWYDGVTKDNVINSFKACGIGAIGGADDHLIHCLKEGNGITNGLYELTKAREAAEAHELVEILAGFEIEATDEDDTGHVSDIEVVDDESEASVQIRSVQSNA